MLIVEKKKDLKCYLSIHHKKLGKRVTSIESQYKTIKNIKVETTKWKTDKNRKM